MPKPFFTVATIVKISSKRFFRDRIAVFFTLVFPLIFLVIFGSLFGKNSKVSFKVAIINNSQTQFAKQFMDEADQNKLFKIDKTITSLDGVKDKMNRGQIDAAIELPPDFGKVGDKGYPTGMAVIHYDDNNQQTAQTLSSVLDNIFTGINTQFVKYDPPFKVTSKSTNNTGLTSFDYVFSGMLGFAIIGLGIFGPTNTFPEQKKQGILRRLRSTPVSTAQFVLSNVFSYVFFGLLSIGLLFIVGLGAFHLNMRGNYLTFAAFSILGIITIFGFGMAVGGWAKNEQQSAPLSNLVAFPMMFLSGTFFPTYLMPTWLQKVAHYLPLTPINEGIRLIITENKGLTDLGPQLGLIGIWLVVIYAIAFRVFRWE